MIDRCLDKRRKRHRQKAQSKSLNTKRKPLAKREENKGRGEEKRMPSVVYSVLMGIGALQFGSGVARALLPSTEVDTAHILQLKSKEVMIATNGLVLLFVARSSDETLKIAITGLYGIRSLSTIGFHLFENVIYGTDLKSLAPSLGVAAVESVAMLGISGFLLFKMTRKQSASSTRRPEAQKKNSSSSVPLYDCD